MDRTAYFGEFPMVGGVVIPKSEFIKEHVNLLQILKSGTRSQRKKEAADQSAELAKVMKKRR